MKKVIVDYRITYEEKYSLEKLGYDILFCPPSNILYDAVSGHPDMLLHFINKNTILLHKTMENSFVNKLKALNYNILFSEKELQSCYPNDIILNALNLGNVLVHNLKHTDNTLLNHFEHLNKIHVKQGYTKCSTAIVNDHAIITSDTGIAKALYKLNFDILLIPPGDILLPGLDYGFIGGCCGLLEPNLLAFFGNLKFYKNGDIVLDFLKKHKVTPVFLSKNKLVDRGTLFSLNT